MEEVLIEEQQECKPLIVNDSLFQAIFNSDTNTSNPINIFEDDESQWNKPYSVHIGMKDGCFWFPLNVSGFNNVSTRMICGKVSKNDTITMILQMYADWAGGLEHDALLRIYKNRFDFSTIQSSMAADSCIVQVLFNKQNGIWERHFELIHF